MQKRDKLRLVDAGPQADSCPPRCHAFSRLRRAKATSILKLRRIRVLSCCLGNAGGVGGDERPWISSSTSMGSTEPVAHQNRVRRWSETAQPTITESNNSLLAHVLHSIERGCETIRLLLLYWGTTCPARSRSDELWARDDLTVQSRAVSALDLGAGTPK